MRCAVADKKGLSRYRQKVSPLGDMLPKLTHVLVVDAKNHPGNGFLSLSNLMAESDDTFIMPPTDPEDIPILQFTSGTTGMSKGAIHVHNAVCRHCMTGKYVLDFHPGTGGV